MRIGRLLSVPIFPILLLVSLSVFVMEPPATAKTEPDTLDKIEPLLLAELQTGDQVGFFIWLSEKADLSPASQLPTKEEKGRFVYEALRDTAERTQKDLRRALDRDGVAYHSFYIANKILVLDGDSTLVLDVASRPDVARVTANHKYHLEEPVPAPAGPLSTLAVEPNISFVKADEVWALGVTGTGIVLAGNDTGLDEDHPAIAPHYRGCLDPECSVEDHNYNWWDATKTYPTDPQDGHGHGTHTTGTMVGDDGGTNQIGVAPGAMTIHCKNMNDGGTGTDANFIECFEWDLAPWDLNRLNPRPDLAPDAVNNSWGGTGGGAPQFEDEIAALQAAGILVEASAGNEGDDCGTLRSPGDYDEVLTTGSVDHNTPYPGVITARSSRGPSSLDPAGYFPDIMAPGESVRSSLPNGQYDEWSGTSMSGPHVTALAGLIWSACPALRGQVGDTMQLIKDTAAPLTGQTGKCGGDYVTGPNNDWGHGTIDALAAVNAALAWCAVKGSLEGQVLDADSLAAIEGAIVRADLATGNQWEDTTDDTGRYTLTLPAGTYTVTAEVFGYMSDTVTMVAVETNTVTTQDFYLLPIPEYVVSGTVVEVGTGIPLRAEVQVLGTPLAPASTDPVTGFYSITVPAGTYTFRATAPGHKGEERPVVVDHDQTQSYTLAPVPCILLVDDDNDAPDVRGYYTAALSSLGYAYDVFEVADAGNGPTLLELAGYPAVIWFSGDQYGDSAGPNATDEANLTGYLEDGGRLLLSSQDYLWDRGLSSFGGDYLGIGSYGNDTGGASSKYGVRGSPLGSEVGPYPLSYPPGFSDFADIVNAGAGAAVVFGSSPVGGHNLDIAKVHATWRTVFFGTSWVPMHNHKASNGEEVLQRIARWFGICGESMIRLHLPIVLEDW